MRKYFIGNIFILVVLVILVVTTPDYVRLNAIFYLKDPGYPGYDFGSFASSVSLWNSNFDAYGFNRTVAINYYVSFLFSVVFLLLVLSVTLNILMYKQRLEK